MLLLARWMQQQADDGHEAQGGGTAEAQRRRQGQLRQQQQGQQQQAEAYGVVLSVLPEMSSMSGVWHSTSTLQLCPGCAGTAGSCSSNGQCDAQQRLVQEHVVRALHACPLRRALSGPCARLLVLATGLRTLCALDGEGGHYYGLPEAAGLQHLPLVLNPEEEDEVQRQRLRGVVVIGCNPLVNLLTLLVMRRCGSEAGARAEPPSRGTRLHLTLRVARAAAGGAAAAAAAAGEGSSRSRRTVGGGHPTYALPPVDAIYVAVMGLHLAWRHVPPAGRDGSRRREALRRWATAAAAVADGVARCGAVLQGPDWDDDVAYQLGLLLALHPTMVPRLEHAGAWYGPGCM